MESGSHAVPRTMAAPVTTDSISPAHHPLTFTVVWASWPSPFKGLLLLQSAAGSTVSSPVAFLFSVVRQLPGWPWGEAGQAEKGGSCSCRAVSQDVGEARALACPGQGQETGGFAEAQTGRSVERPMSRCPKATKREAGMGGTLLSLS